MGVFRVAVTEHLTWQTESITKTDRHKLNGHRSAVVWLTGLSGAGKSTLANAVARKLHAQQIRNYILDGDNIRHGLNKGLGFTASDRKENIRRIGELAKLFVDSGLITLVATISPFQADRDLVRRLFTEDEFIEVYVKCSLEICEERDPKGLYAQVRDGKIPSFTGISSPYEEPYQPEITVETDQLSIDDASDMIIHYLHEKNITHL